MTVELLELRRTRLELERMEAKHAALQRENAALRAKRRLLIVEWIKVADEGHIEKIYAMIVRLMEGVP